MRPNAFTQKLIKIFPFLSDDDDEIFGEYLLEKISDIADAVSIETENNWLGLCRYCGTVNLDYSDERHNFYSNHKQLCQLINDNIEIEFFKCLI